MTDGEILDTYTNLDSSCLTKEDKRGKQTCCMNVKMPSV